MVRREQVRAVLGPDLLEPGDPDPVEDVDERVDQQHLRCEADRPDDRRQRPAPGRHAVLRATSRLDERGEVGDGRLGFERVVVDEHAELLLDDAEQLHPPQGVQVEIRSTARRSVRTTDGSSPATLATTAVSGSTAASTSSRRTFDAAPGIGADPGRSSSPSLARMSGLRTLSVWVRGRSGSGHDGRAADLLVRREPLVRRRHDRILERRVIEEQDRVDAQVGPERPADDRRVLDARVVAQDRLEVLGVHLLPVGQREHVLLAAAEREHAVGREGTEIAGVVPAVGVDRGGGRLGVLPVAGEAPRPAGQDLAVVGDPGLDAGDRLAHRPDDIPFRSGEADDGAHLGRAVALQDVDAHLGPALGDLQVEGRRPDADRVEPAAELAAAQAGTGAGAASAEPGARFGAPARTGRAGPSGRPFARSPR